MTQEEMKRDQYIKSLLEEAGTDQPSTGFTANVMKSIKAEMQPRALEYRPVISRKAWIVIGILGGVFLILLFSALPGQPQPTALYDFDIDRYLKQIGLLLQNVKFSFSLSPVFIIGLLAFLLLLFLDMIFQARQGRNFS